MADSRTPEEIRRAAREILERFGLTLSADSAERARRFLERLRARRVLEGIARKLAPKRISHGQHGRHVGILQPVTRC